jgi:hypothetical protein
MEITPPTADFVKNVLLRLVKKPTTWVVVLLAVFGFVIWNGEEAKKRSEIEYNRQKADDKKNFGKLADLLVEASCDRKKSFKTLVWGENAGLKYVSRNYQTIYNIAKEKNKNNCSLLSLPDALPGVDNETSIAINVPEGWETTSKEGVYSKWCKVGECDASRVIGEQRYAILMVWCKESPCGDIYARANLLNASGVVIGYTNDTGYGSKGDKVQLTLSSYSDFSRMQLTELNLR